MMAPGGDVADEPGLGADLGALAHAQVPGHRGLAADLDEVFQHGGARDADLGDDDAAAAEADVVADLHQVIEAGTGADDGVLHGAAVDGGVGADLDVVLDQHAAELGNGEVAGFGVGEAEAFLADTDAGGQRHAVAEEGVADADMGADAAVLAELDAGGEADIGTEAAVGADADLVLDDGKGADLGRGVDGGAGVNEGGGVDAGVQRRQGVEHAGDAGPALVGGGDLDGGGGFGDAGCHVWVDDDGAGLGLLQGGDVAAVVQEADFVGLGGA